MVTIIVVDVSIGKVVVSTTEAEVSSINFDVGSTDEVIPTTVVVNVSTDNVAVNKGEGVVTNELVSKDEDGECV